MLDTATIKAAVASEKWAKQKVVEHYVPMIDEMAIDENMKQHLIMIFPFHVIVTEINLRIGIVGMEQVCPCNNGKSYKSFRFEGYLRIIIYLNCGHHSLS